MGAVRDLTMLPDNVESSIAFGGVYLHPDELAGGKLVDFESGGPALLDSSQGFFMKTWKISLEDDTDVTLTPDGGDPIVLFQASGITELTLCFDQNMRYAVGYVQNDVLKLRWFDSFVNAHVVSEFGAGTNPKMALDDKRLASVITSDMIFAYMRGSSLCYRQQRDRFTIERELRTGLFPGTQLKGIGMNKNLRLQFELV